MNNESLAQVLARGEESQETRLSWQCTKCNRIFLQKNIARLHLRVRHNLKPSASSRAEVQLNAPSYLCLALQCTVCMRALKSISKRTTGILAGRAYALGSLQEDAAGRSYQVLEGLIDDRDDPSLSPLINYLIHAARHRHPILNSASTLGGADPELMSALTSDEEHIVGLLRTMPDTDKSSIVGLRGLPAADLLNLLDLPPEEQGNPDPAS
ncbi:uncharacterized protein PHACADRAFT_33235 [Phanerochaete carnosa HHB-10118-sp]|uniref:C2H2-type domain-containing protein n=1 Tax=Phanerochaete carnosa (strain HHB-10118-sp) TaxID=650164 RepID=K5WHG8_PHACS|nr:uncharacterized protein PHACADRAFT_33235 [Phanerochaete carnosa HHB-10118-sp]EKM49667.1 hypothetical protein PHACADRAFT_33235 [Phanerochaete carnosa HHB-10118-sp]